MNKFSKLTLISFAGFFVSVFLHNAFYALSVMTSHITALSCLMGVLDVFFFLIAIFACPLGFLVGIVGSITLFVRKKYKGK